MSSSDVLPSIALIGAGQLGSRHLQSLTTLPHAVIDVLDPNDSALALAKERAEACGISNVKIRYLRDVSQLGEHYHVAIIATNAAVRFGATNALLAAANVDYMIFEKVLFQHLSEYDRMQRVLAENEVSAVVNCPRRMYPLYHWVKQRYLGQLSSTTIGSNRSIVVEGNLWGLAGNSIHFIDLYAYLYDAVLTSVEVDNGCETIESKRSGYVELTGTLSCKFDDGGTLTLISKSDSAQENTYTVKLHNADQTLIIDEVSGLATNNVAEPLAPAMPPPFQSQLSASVVTSLIASQQCKLTGFTESSFLHKPLLNALTRYFSGQESIDGDCPIT